MKSVPHYLLKSCLLCAIGYLFVTYRKLEKLRHVTYPKINVIYKVAHQLWLLTEFRELYDIRPR